MKQLVFYSPIFGPEGYSEVGRGFLCSLERLGWNVKLLPFDNWGPWKIKLPGYIEKTLQRTISNDIYPQKEPVPFIHVCLPEQVKLSEQHVNINYSMFEASRIPVKWAEASRVFDHTLVPNEFCRQIFTCSGIPQQKVSTVPLGFDPKVFNDSVEPLPLMFGNRCVLDYPFRFLAILEITNRKNFAGLLDLYFNLAAKLGVDNCCLLLKAANYSQPSPIPALVQRIKHKLVNENSAEDLQYNVFNYPPLLPVEQMGSFMRIGTHYLSVSLSEGWDLNCLNAMACGVPVIVPDHSGYTAYCNRSVACMLPVFTKVEALQQQPLTDLYAGAHWFGCDGPESKQIVLDYICDGNETLKRAQRAYTAVHTNFTWDSVTRQLEKELEAIL